MPAVFGADEAVAEDMSPVLILSDVKATPVFSMMHKGEKVKADLFDWPVTGMGARRPAGVPENQDVQGFEGDKAQKLYNRVQMFRRTPRVTIKAEKINNNTNAGLKYDGQVTKKIAEQKRDIEYRLLSYKDSAQDDGVVGDEFKGLGKVIDDGTIADADSVTAIPTAYKTPAAQIYSSTLAAFKETDLRDMAKARFDALGQTSEFTIVCGSTLKAWISDTFGNYVADRASFTVSARTEKQQFDMKKFTMSTIELIQSEFGTFALVMSSWIGSDGTATGSVNLKAGYGLDMDALNVRPLMYCDHTELEPRGGGRSGFIDSILGYEYGDPRMHLKILAS